MPGSSARRQPAPLSERYLVFALGVGVFLASLAVFLTVSLRGVFTDITLHAKLAWSLVTQGGVIANFLYFLVVGALGLLMEWRPKFVLESYVLASYLVLCAAVCAKFVVSQCMASSLAFDSGPRPGLLQSPLNPVTLALTLFALSFAFCLPVQKFYPGQFPPNVWHNSTTIFLMPFAVGLFWKSYRYLESGDRAELPAIAVLVVLNLLVKPSMFFAFAPVFPLFCLLRFGWTRPFFLGAGLTALGGLFLALQYWAIFLMPERNVYLNPELFRQWDPGKTRGVEIDFFYVWQRWSPSPLRSFLASFLFPLVFWVLYAREAVRSRLVLYATACMAVAMGVMITFKETGGVETAGNFAWQVIVCNYLWFLACIIEFFRIERGRDGLSLRARIVAGSYAVHLFFGIVYLVWIVGVKGVMMGGRTTFLPIQ